MECIAAELGKHKLKLFNFNFVFDDIMIYLMTKQKIFQDFRLHNKKASFFQGYSQKPAYIS